MSFTLEGQTLQIDVTVTEGTNPILSNPNSGEYRIKEIKIDTDGKSVKIVHDDTPEP